MLESETTQLGITIPLPLAKLLPEPQHSSRCASKHTFYAWRPRLFLLILSSPGMMFVAYAFTCFSVFMYVCVCLHVLVYAFMCVTFVLVYAYFYLRSRAMCAICELSSFFLDVYSNSIWNNWVRKCISSIHTQSYVSACVNNINISSIALLAHYGQTQHLPTSLLVGGSPPE